MKRTPLKRKPSTLAKSRLKPVSARRKVELKAYTLLRKAYLGNHPICEWQGCKNKADQIHHKNHRHKDRLNDVTHWMAICFWHHRDAHDHPAIARELGYLI